MPGLRERNITTAKATIQTHAIGLFMRRGYSQTTVEQIAQAAEVSPRTFFRYFKTKEAVILYDSIDPIIISAFLKQPSHVPPIRAMRAAVRELTKVLPLERQELELQRFELLNSLPSLKDRAFGEMLAQIDHFSETIARRANKNPGDVAVRNLAGAIIGVVITVLQQTYKNPTMAIYESEMDKALARLEKGLDFD